jgi:hypothetical protein
MGSDLDMGTNKITSVVDPTSAQEGATKNYVDTNYYDQSTSDSRYLRTDGNNTMSANLDMGGSNKITSLVNPTSAQEGATKDYVDNNKADVSTWHQYTAGGEVDIGDHKIINCNAPSNNKDVVNLQYFNTNNAAEQNLIKQILDYQPISVPNGGSATHSKTITGLDQKHYKCDVELVLVGGLEFTQKYVKLVHFLQDDGVVDALDPIQHVVDNVSTNHTATYANLGNIEKSFNNNDEYTFHYNFTLLSNNTTSLTFNTKVLESGGFDGGTVTLSCDSFMRIFIQPMSIIT